jgi:tRNA-dihydrouridine synthase
MQGLTNRAFRAVVARIGKPDQLFTEFVRVRPRAKQVIASSDFVEATTTVPGIPLHVQVIGAPDEVGDAVRDLVARGVEHVNVNMGCPWGRMTSVLAGGGMFRHPETVEPMLRELRAIVPGQLSVKTRAGLEDEREIFGVLAGMEAAGIDFLVVHPRTVAQKYRGEANHALTKEIVERCSFAVIANGDVRDEERAARVLEQTGAAGLMLGRGAVSDPLLFERVRGRAGPRPVGAERRRELAAYLAALLEGYREIFHGDAQILAKLKEVLAHIDDEDLARWIKKLRKTKRVDDAEELLASAA